MSYSFKTVIFIFVFIFRSLFGCARLKITLKSNLTTTVAAAALWQKKRKPNLIIKYLNLVVYFCTTIFFYIDISFKKNIIWPVLKTPLLRKYVPINLSYFLINSCSFFLCNLNVSKRNLICRIFFL